MWSLLYAQGKASSMAEEEGDLESERFKKQLGSLLNCRTSDEYGTQSKDYCARFCELVEEQTGRWQVPLPQLQVLRTALCCFARDTASFPSDCEHVRYALSSLALSFFELLLFFGKDEFLESPLKEILESFQECQTRLLRHKNVYLLLLRQVVKDGGPWEHAVLQAILGQTAPPREEVERYLSSEVPVFFELRVRYLLACERIQEAVALAKGCMEHPDTGRRLYFHQAYLTCLLKASLYDHLQKEIAEIDGKDAVEIICNSENEERDDLLLALSRAFLTQQLQNGDMYYIWDLIFIWSKIHLRANPSKQDFLEECHQLMLSATNVKSIFPFIKVIRAELGNEGLQFCVELCGRALQMDLHQDPVSKLLIYKTLAFLLPNDLEVCRACALLVFFLERTVESYKTMYLLYTHPDQEYQADHSLIKNHIRFEILQILKKGLFFDPEFWNLITLRTNCLKLMSEKVMQSALKEIMEEDKWIPNDCVKEPSKIILDTPVYRTDRVRSRPEKRFNKPVMKRIVVPPDVVEVSLVKKRGRKPGSRVIKVTDDSQLRRSFRQLDMAQENSSRQIHQKHDNRQQRLLARQGEKKTLKRRGRKPRWLLQEVAKQAENGPGQPGWTRQLPTNAEVEMKLRDRSPVQTVNDSEKVQEVSVEQTSCDIELTPPSPVEETADDETVLLQEEGMPLLAAALPNDPLLSPVPLTMLEVSIPDNEVMDMSALEVEMQPPADVAAFQEPSLEDQVSVEVVSTVGPFTECGDREEDSADNPSGDSWCALPPVARSEVFPESAVEVDNVVIQQLHNYSRNPEEENVHVPDAVPEELPTAPQERPSESTEPEQMLSGQVCELLPVEVSPLLQTPAGAASSSEADEASDSMPAAVEAVEEVSEAVWRQEVIQAEPSCAVVETSVSDNVISVPDDETTIPNAPCSAPQHTISALDEGVIACTGTDTIENLVNAFSSDDITADPSNETVPTVVIDPSTETVPNDKTVPKGVTVPSTETVPDNKTVPKGVPDPSVETFPNDKTVPKGVTLPSDETVPKGVTLPSDETVPKGVTLPSDETVPKGVTLPNNETVPNNKTVPKGVTLPRDETVLKSLTVPSDDTVPSGVTVLSDETIASDDTVPSNSVNNVINETVSRTDAAPDSGRDSGLPMELSQTEIIEPEKVSSEPEPEPVSGLVLDSLQSKVLEYHCQLCNKEFKGGNIRRHAIAHLQRDKLKCMFCGKLFNRPRFAKKHLGAHILKLRLDADTSSGLAPENGTPVTLECARRSLSRSAKHKVRPKKSAQKTVPSKKRKCTQKLKVLQKLEEVRESNSVKDKKPVQKTNGSIVEGEIKCEKEEYSCPADGCTKKFVRRGMSMIKHALASHPGDIKVQEFAFNWRKGKCEFCQRIFWSFLHYQDHRKRHDHPLRYSCLHVDCDDRFKTKSELRAHLKSHRPLKAQCSFAGCSQTFCRLSQLQDHEWRHYPAPDAEDDALRTMQMRRKLGRPAGGKRKAAQDDSVKVQDMSAEPPAAVLNSGSGGGKAVTDTVEVEAGDKVACETGAVNRPVGREGITPPQGRGSDAQIVNGHRENVTVSHAQVDAVSAPRESDKEAAAEIDNVDGKAEESAASPTQKGVKRVEVESSGYGATSGRPFVRPPPSAYLDECYISMPKRRKSSPDDPRSSREPSGSSVEAPRRRCSKCFSSFKCEEALQSHLSLNKCTSLFGFDSDEESAW